MDPRSLSGLRPNIAVAAAALILAGCAPVGNPAPATAGLRAAARRASADPIQHVVFVVQENRSFDNLFQGFPGADTASSGPTSDGKTVKLKPVTLASRYDVDHGLKAFLTAYDGGKMDGFDREQIFGPPNGPEPAYAYVPHHQTKLYFDIGKQYVVADRMFTSHIDGSFVSHQYIIAGQAQRSVDLPNGDWGCEGGHTDHINTLLPDRTYGPAEPVCFSSRTLADEADAAGLTWHAYANSATDGWNGFSAIDHIYYGKGWGNVSAPSAQFLSDVANGSLANLTWITPSCPESDHAGCTGLNGPDWVASVVNAVGTSPFWNSTTIFVMWDDWGGWYDHVAPPYLDYDGLGLRVPLVVVSPYAKQGYVSHVQYEHGSLLRYAEDRFGLARLAASDARAASPLPDCFDMSQAPRAFAPFKSSLRPADFLRRRLDPRVPDAQ